MSTLLSIKPARRLSMPSFNMQVILIQPAFRLLFTAPIIILPELTRRLTTGGYAELLLDRHSDGDRIVYDPTLAGGGWPEFHVGGLLSIGGHAAVVAVDSESGILRPPARSLTEIRRLIGFIAFQSVAA
ncbi:hypothetical protein COW53_00370 [bacterium CG17_big_fil_post_rev_8_21_14_2_50_64_8]|nr:MAG: hypothetical protein COW53_00370 [bacterium CG17_big_fil_post_rev_8_21_14_2_50_64_8]